MGNPQPDPRLRLAIIGNPTVANGMKFAGETRDQIKLSENDEIASGQLDRTGNLQHADSVVFIPGSPEVTIAFVDERLEKLILHNLGYVAIMDGQNVVGYTKREDVFQVPNASKPVLCLLPVRPIAEYPANLADDPGNIWITCAIPDGNTEYTFERPSGRDYFARHPITFIGHYREKAQDNSAIPEGRRVQFRGGATAAGLAGWKTGFPAPAGLAAMLA